MTLDDILNFCYPHGIQHPLSRGRLCVLANEGPLVRRHNYTSCLCEKCKTLVRDRRKTEPYARRVFNGELFTEANIPPKKSKAKKETSISSSSSAVVPTLESNPAPIAPVVVEPIEPVPPPPPTVILPPLVSPAPAGSPKTPKTKSSARRAPSSSRSTARSSTMKQLDTTDEFVVQMASTSVASTPNGSNASTMRTMETLVDNAQTNRTSSVDTQRLNAAPTSTLVSSSPSSSPPPPVASSPSASSSPSPALAVVPHSTLHNSVGRSLELHPEYYNHTIDQLDYLCTKCQIHIRSEAHIFGGIGGKNVVGNLQLNELSRKIEEEDLLRAYNRFRKLSLKEEREFLSKLDTIKLARAKLNYTREQIGMILKDVPRLKPEDDGTNKTSIDPVGHPDHPHPHSHRHHQHQHDPNARMDFYDIQRAIRTERQTRISRLSEMYPDASRKGDNTSTHPKDLQSSAITLEHATIRGNSKKWEGEDKSSVNGVSWKGESILTTAMLQRQYPPHQSYALRTRLLHKHTHDVVPLGPGINHPSVQLSVALMRNQYASDQAEGWKSHF